MIADVMTGWLRPIICFFWISLMTNKNTVASSLKNKSTESRILNSKGLVLEATTCHQSKQEQLEQQPLHQHHHDKSQSRLHNQDIVWSNGFLFVLLSAMSLIQFVVAFLYKTTGGSIIIWHLFHALSSGLLSLVIISMTKIPTDKVVEITAFAFVVDSLTPLPSLSTSSSSCLLRLCLFFLSGLIGIIGARITERICLSNRPLSSFSSSYSSAPSSSLLLSSYFSQLKSINNNNPCKRRHSSPVRRPLVRQTSFPNLGETKFTFLVVSLQPLSLMSV